MPTDEILSPPQNTRRALTEFCVGYGLILLVLWAPRPWQKPLYWAPVLWIAITQWRSSQGRDALGLRATNLLRSLWIVAAALVIVAAAVLLAIHLGTLNAPPTPLLFFKTYIGYAVWSFVQQFLLLDFFLWRLRSLFPRPLIAALVAAAIFALAHLPNPILTPLTLLWGLASCLLFFKYRNLYTLGLAHALFGICVAITIPGAVTHNMRVGLGYLRYHHP